MLPYLVRNDDGDYWSNENGWVDLESADLFTFTERRTLDLPIGGTWVMPAPEGVTQAHWDLGSRDASLGVGHVWTRMQCTAYRTYDPADCTCRRKP